MNIPYSKKELYRDIIKLKADLDRVRASNIELAILNEQHAEWVKDNEEALNDYQEWAKSQQ